MGRYYHRLVVLYGLLADAVLALHLAFVAFAVAGALCVARWPRIAWLHAPAALWAAWIELAGWICPLTPLENALRERAGQAGYSGGLVEHYLLAWLYPDGLTPQVQIALGIAVLVLNALLYAWIIRGARARGSRAAHGAS
jgi:hypothetical protein